MPARTPDVSVILVSYNTAGLLDECLARLQRATDGIAHEFIIVDNASRDHSAELVKRRYPEHRLIENRQNVGFARAVNQALAQASGRYALLVNTDALVEEDSVAKTVAYMDAHPDCGILGAKLVYPDGRLQPSARYFPTPWNVFLQRTGLERFFKGVRTIDDLSWDHASVRQCDWVPGCYYLVRKALIEQIGAFDPRYFLYYEEVDQCLAAKKAGWRVVCYPGTTVTHLQAQSAQTVGRLERNTLQLEALQIESELLYFRKNHGRAGLLAHLALTTLGDALGLLSRLLKRRTADAAARAAHAALVWSLVGRTHGGTQPTR
jgi:GT2 family glycosyltransferase